MTEEARSPLADIPLDRLAHDLRTPLGAILGFAELLHDGKAGALSAAQQEMLGEILGSARDLARRLEGALGIPAEAATPAGGPPAPGPEPEATSTPRAGRRTILVIEDNPEDRAWLAGILTGAHYVVDTAATGAEALARCRARPFDGITLDLLLPDMTGWDILRVIRESGPNRHVPVVVASAVPTKVAAAGFVVRDVVTKPVKAEELLAALARAGVPPGATKAILVVDDDVHHLKLARAALESRGYRVACHADGEAALRAASEELPGAVLLDLLMPGMDGFTLLDHLRRLPGGWNVPVIVWTAKDLTREEHARLRASAEAVVEKRRGGVDAMLLAIEAHIGPAEDER